MTVELDPFTLLTNGTANWLQTSAPIKRAMGQAIKNFEAYNKNRSGTKPDVTSESDVPELWLEANGGPVNINTASHICSLSMGFTLMLNSGDQKITRHMYPVLFAIFAQLASGIHGSPITALQWKGKPFCRKYEFTNVTTGKMNPEMQRGVKGWIALCSLMFHCHFNKSDIDAFVSGT